MSHPKPFRAIKPEIRILGIDDGKFAAHTHDNVVIVGVVFRGGYSIDGVMHTTITVDGLDASEKLASMINGSPHRRQVRVVMLNGVTLAGFNVVDIKKLNSETKLPVIVLTRNKPDLDSIQKALENLPAFEERWSIILHAGEIHQFLNRGTMVYMEVAGISLTDAQKIVRLTSTRSCLPEPLRVAHLIASGISD